MSELTKFLFEGLPVRGLLVRLTDSWREVLRRREAAGGYPAPVRELLGEMAAAGTLMQANIKFNGVLVLQVLGDGPVKLAVAEVQSDLAFRATAKIVGKVAADAQLEALVNVHGKGRCAITLDPRDRLPGQQPYQGVVPLHGDRREPLISRARELTRQLLAERHQFVFTPYILAETHAYFARSLPIRLQVLDDAQRNPVMHWEPVTPADETGAIQVLRLGRARQACFSPPRAGQDPLYWDHIPK